MTSPRRAHNIHGAVINTDDVAYRLGLFTAAGA